MEWWLLRTGGGVEWVGVGWGVTNEYRFHAEVMKNSKFRLC